MLKLPPVPPLPRPAPPWRCPRCQCTPASPCRPACGPVYEGLACARCAVEWMAHLVNEAETMRRAAPKGQIWKVTASPVGEGLDLVGRLVPISGLDAEMRAQAAACLGEPVLIEVEDAERVWSSIFRAVLVRSESAGPPS